MAETAEIPLTRQDLYPFFSDVHDGLLNSVDLIKTFLRQLSAEEEMGIHELVRNMINYYRTCWKKCSRMKKKYLENNKAWLNGHVSVPRCLLKVAHPHPQTSSTGRPEMSYEQKGLRAQQYDVANIVETQTQPTLAIIKATSRTIGRRGHRDASYLIKQTFASPKRSSRIRRLIKLSHNTSTFTPTEALTLMLDLNLSTNQYIKIRKAIIQKGHKGVFPPYYKVAATKLECRPNSTEITINDDSAAVSLNGLLDHTASRISSLQQATILRYIDDKKIDIATATLICSYGFDGSTGQSRYKQRPSSSSVPAIICDASLFATTLVPLQLITDDNIILWRNTTPQSPRFCRPIKLSFENETPQLVLKTKDDLEAQIRDLPDFNFRLPGTKSLKIHYDLHLTLIDGKVLNIITNTTSHQVCPICSSTPTQFNKLDNIKLGVFNAPSERLVFGASPLHAYIRFLEMCLHISYRLEFKKWRVSRVEDKQAYKKRKTVIQQNIQENMGIIVDMPKPGGSGTTNDGNTARRLFSNYIVFSSILGLDEELILRLRTILVALNCNLEIDPEKFGRYCAETAETYVSLYPWYFMPATVHKILIHGRQIIESSILPIGMFAEDAGEARNKLYKRFRLFHARKCSRKATMEDLFYRSMDSSDPVISSTSLTERTKTRRMPLPTEVVSLLKVTAPMDVPTAILFDVDPLDESDSDSDGGNCVDLVLSDDEDPANPDELGALT